ncbi:hypothetical protein [Blautia wexlerae]|uniref:hypothetical protein n=1 Tax=Blautia wexlerae TaxID=418240 RepID=UPI0034A2401F
MTKIKNTKKGMAKKTLSMSLVVAMLATSNVPVWAAEFSDGSDVAVETEAPVVEDNAADTAEAFTDDETPVVDNEENAVVATAESDYDFSGITVNQKAINPTWAGKTESGSNTFTSANVFGTSAIKKNGAAYTGDDLRYVWAYNGAWDINTRYPIYLSSNTFASAITLPDTATLKEHVGETLSLIILEKENGVVNATPIDNISLGTIKPVDVSDTGVTASITPAPVYDGADKKPSVTVNDGTWSSTYAADLKDTTKYNWSYDGTDGLKNANSIVTVTGTYNGADAKCYTGTLKTTFTIGKLDLQTNTGKAKIIVKAATPGKKFSYAGGNLEVDKSEVNVYLADANDSTKASDISLNDFVKKVTVDASQVGKDKTFTVTFDAAKINASANFKDDAKADFTVASAAKYDGNDNSAEIEALDLSKITVTLKSPKKVGVSTTGSGATGIAASDLTFTKDGKEISISNLVNVSLKEAKYDKPGTYEGAIIVTGSNSNAVTGTATANLIVKTNVFGDGAGFKKGSGNSVTSSQYLTDSKLKITGTNGLTVGLDYNNGKAVEFKATDLFTDSNADALLGWFDPTGTGTKAADQSCFHVKYSNNVNATPQSVDNNTSDEKIAVLTVYAVGGDYDGCSKDFYFKINASKVEPTNTSSSTVTTNANENSKGVSFNEDATDASDYAAAIGLKVTGTNGETGNKKITSEASSNDYKVEYSFAKDTNDTAFTSSDKKNAVGRYIKAVITLKKDGNFVTPSVGSSGELGGNGKSGVTFTTAKPLSGTDNGTITLYIPIIDKSIEDLDITLDQTSYTFTGTTIEPKVSVKLNGKAFEAGKDYTVKVNNGINVGTAEVVVTMLDHSKYQGSKKLSATITPAKLSDVKFEIKKDCDQVYDTTRKKPVIAQKDDPTTTNKNEAIAETAATAQVKLGTNVISDLFDITYGQNVEAGKDAGTVTLTPKKSAAKNFDGSSVTATFDIKRRTLENKSSGWAVKLVNDDGKIITRSNSKVIAANETDFEWTGNETIFANASLVADNIDYKQASSEANKPEIRTNDFTYKLAYANNVEKTTTDAPAFVCVVGTGNYGGEYSIVKSKSGKVTVETTESVEKANKETPGTYEVLLDNVVKDSWASFQIEGRRFAAKNVTITNATYAGGVAVKPGSVVKDSKTGTILTEGKDYELVFDKENVNATNTPIEVTVKGIGQYKGSLVNAKTDGKKLTFIIEKKDLKDCSVSVDKNLKLTVMNGNVLETKENFTVKDNGDGTATVSVVDGGKNYTGSVNVEIGGRKVGAPMISNVKVVGNKATVILSDDVEGASGYDYVISTDKDCITNKDYAAVNKNQAKTTTTFKYVDKGTYYAYCHAWTRDANGKKVFGEWSNGFQFSVTATTPDAPVITDVKVSGSTIKVTYRPAANATGYDVVLGTSSKKDNGELRPYNYGAHKKLNLKEGTVTATFKKVPKGTWTVGMHAFNRTSIDNKKVFSPWSNLETAKVK